MNSATAQVNKYKQNGIDSAAIDGKIQADKARRDSIANAIILKRKADSLNRELAKLKLQQFRDSIITARNAKRKADSLAREQVKLALLNKKRISDSLAKDRIRIQDSTRMARLNRSDSMRVAKEKLAKQRKLLEKYKNSRRFKDSVATVHKTKTDSIANVRNAQKDIQQQKAQASRDSLANIRTHNNDSIKQVRQHYNDSVRNALQILKTERQKANDLLAATRKQRADSLTALRASKDKKTAESEKNKIAKQKALAIKIHDTKQQEWTNEKLLKRKWGLRRRIYQNTVTRYNYYYNAHRKYNDAIRNLKKNNKDDYTKLIPVYPYDVQKAGTSVAGDMDSVIKKASFSTQIHDPRSKWFDNLYFLMGRASFIKNDFDGAITTFQFIANEYKDTPKKKKKTTTAVKAKVEEKKDGLSIASVDNRKGLHKLSHHPIRNEALLWLAKSYMEAQQYSEATALLSTLEKDKVFPKRNKPELYLTKATLEIKQDNKTDAIESLNNALKYKLSGVQRARTEFVLGQLYAGEGDYAKSTAHYKNSFSGKANPEMDFYTKLFIAENAAKGGGDKQYALTQLEKISKDPKFEKYKSQAYNVMASIYEEDNTEKAIEVLQKSVKASDAKEPFQKAVAYAMLGKLYYKQADYVQAKISYDSASFYGSNPALDNIDEVNTRKTVLTDVVKNIRIIRRQDSLLALSLKSDKEQKAAAKKEAERLKKAEAPAAEANPQVVALAPGNTPKSNWYFYNNTLMEKGASDFRQKWGNRKLQDNWRRSAASSNMMESSSGEEEAKDSAKSLINGSQYETLLAEIPKTPQQKDKANESIMNAWYDLGLIYYAQLKDYTHSVSSFDTLLYRYPSTKYKKETYYTLFLDYSLLKNEPMSEKYKKLLNDEFGQTEFAKLANNPDYLEDLKDIKKNVDYYYDTTYMAYKDTQYALALTRIAYAQQTLKGNPIMVKFDLLEGVCNAALRDYAKCKVNLEGVIKNYPGTKQQEKAQQLLNYLKATAPEVMNDSSSSKQNTKVDSAASKAISEIKAAEGMGVYTYNSNDEHQLLIYINKIDGKAMALKAGLSDFNSLKHDSEGLTTGQTLFTIKEGVVTVSKFSNSVFAKIYMNDVMKDPNLFKQYQKEDYNVCLISASNFNELVKTRDILGYLTFYAKNYK